MKLLFLGYHYNSGNVELGDTVEEIVYAEHPDWFDIGKYDYPVFRYASRAQFSRELEVEIIRIIEKHMEEYPFLAEVIKDIPDDAHWTRYGDPDGHTYIWWSLAPITAIVDYQSELEVY